MVGRLSLESCRDAVARVKRRPIGAAEVGVLVAEVREHGGFFLVLLGAHGAGRSLSHTFFLDRSLHGQTYQLSADLREITFHGALSANFVTTTAAVYDT